jgi:hypothetical protein
MGQRQPGCSTQVLRRYRASTAPGGVGHRRASHDEISAHAIYVKGGADLGNVLQNSILQ